MKMPTKFFLTAALVSFAVASLNDLTLSTSSRIAAAPISQSQQGTEQVGGVSSEWHELCVGPIFKSSLNSKYVRKSRVKEEEIADVWVKEIPRTDTTDGRKEIQKQIKAIKRDKSSKDRSQAFSYEMWHISFRCNHRRIKIYDKYDYDNDGNLLLKWNDQSTERLGDFLYGVDVPPGSVAECIMEFACKVSSQP